MTADAQQPAPECFARLERVFPLGEDGLRRSPPECLQCAVKTDCLRAAVSGGQGVDVHEEKLGRAYRAGQVGFLERWARQKALEQRRGPAAGRVSFWRRWLRKLT